MKIGDVQNRRLLATFIEKREKILLHKGADQRMS